MAAETVALRNLARRVKQAALEKAEFVLNNPNMVEKELYNETFLTVLKNAVPRTQEVTGEDGQPLVIQIAKEIADKNAINSEPSTDSQEPSPLPSN